MSQSVGVIIGRFQPFHSGHRYLLTQALKTSDIIVIVLGSAHSSRNVRNPLSASERRTMIEENLSGDEKGRVKFAEVRDYFYNNAAWTNEVIEKVRELGGRGTTTLFGFEKDATSSYLRWFPDWKYEHVASTEETSATPLRERYLRESGSAAVETKLSESTKAFLKHFANTPEYALLQEEQRAVDKYKESWSKAPFPPVFVTTDAIVVQAGHMILIKRKKSPGKNLWAIPGGFLDPQERLFDCAIRELKEETQIDVPESVLRESMKEAKPFDHPLRSSRGRTITHAHFFELPGDRLARIQASDDAADAKWVPLLDLAKMEGQFFEDHFHIIQSFLRRGGR